MKTILFSNATYDKKIRTFQTANKMGLRVAVVGTDLPAWAQPYTDLFIKADTYDTDATLSALSASGVHFDGVVTFWDRDVELVAAIAAHLGLPGASIESATAVRNKYLMRELLTKHRVPNIKYARVASLTELEEAIGQVGYPAVLKPVSASASKGVVKVSDAPSAAEAWRTAQAHLVPATDPMFGYNQGQFIVEEFMCGPECSVEALIAGSQVHILGVTEKEIDAAFEEVQHTFPAELSQSDYAQIVELATAALRASGLTNCGTHTEVKRTPEGFRIVEVNGRLAGDFITTDLIPEATGVDVIAATLAVSLGEKPDVAPSRRAASSVRFLIAERRGTLTAVKIDTATLQNDDVLDFRMDKEAGDVVEMPPAKFHDSRIGYVITRGHDTQAARQLAKNLLDSSVKVAYA